MFRPIIVFTLTVLSCSALFGQTTNRLAPGAPGQDAHWPSAAKNGFGTANTLASKVWFTLNDGVMTEVFYPTLDIPNVQTLQLIIVDGTNVETESVDTVHELEVLDPNSLSFRQINKAKSGNYSITKTYVTDPKRNTVLIDIQFEGRSAASLYVYYDPSLNNSGMHDSAWTEREALLAQDGKIASALVSSCGFARRGERMLEFLKPQDRSRALEVTNGYLGTSDGLTELKRNWNRTSFSTYARASNGNVVQVAALKGLETVRGQQDSKRGGSERTKSNCTLALGFGQTTRAALNNARASLAKGFAHVRNEYEAGWRQYVRKLPAVGRSFQAQFNMAAMVLRGLEDKTYRGAMIASPSIPWGGGPNANEPTVSGYHSVWSRDLYHVATAFQALGDRAAANRALTYLFKLQQKPDGSFPQNSRVDGRALGQGLQMDQVAFPLIMAHELGRTDKATWLKHIKPAADFIVRKGPTTEQERWEEEAGYSPASIAAQIAGLVCASRIAKLNGAVADAEVYLTKADEWAREIEDWTVTTTGRNAKGKYYLRITQGDPNAPVTLEINSGGGVYDQRDIVDAGFLELVRLGVKVAEDPAIVESLKVVDRIIRVSTPNGPAWYRYNHDAYGERADGGNYDGRTGKGRLWTLLTGERGEYQVALGNIPAAQNSLEAMMRFGNDGLMIPEQIWDGNEMRLANLRFGEGTGSATPLAWSMAQFIRLALNIRAKQNLETPDAVRARYFKGPGRN